MKRPRAFTIQKLAGVHWKKMNSQTGTSANLLGLETFRIWRCQAVYVPTNLKFSNSTEKLRMNSLSSLLCKDEQIERLKGTIDPIQTSFLNLMFSLEGSAVLECLEILLNAFPSKRESRNWFTDSNAEFPPPIICIFDLAAPGCIRPFYKFLYLFHQQIYLAWWSSWCQTSFFFVPGNFSKFSHSEVECMQYVEELEKGLDNDRS